MATTDPPPPRLTEAKVTELLRQRHSAPGNGGADWAYGATIGICRYEDEAEDSTYLRVKLVTDRRHPERRAEAEWLDDGAVDVTHPDLQGGWIR